MSQIRNRGTAVIPTIDFTVHVQDDGTTVRAPPSPSLSRAPLVRSSLPVHELMHACRTNR